jgi:catechol 2,3-dioxygenase-like lactoylglutathione lyase family enzyme
MNQPFLGLRTAIYHVSDLAAATAWYTQLLGFEPYFKEPFYVGFNVAGYELGKSPRRRNLLGRKRCTSHACATARTRSHPIRSAERCGRWHLGGHGVRPLGQYIGSDS